MSFRIDSFAIEGFQVSPVGVDDHAVIAADALFLTQIGPEPGVKESGFSSEAAAEGGVDVGIVGCQRHFGDCGNTTAGADNADRRCDVDGIDLHAVSERFLDFLQKSDQCFALSRYETVVA